MRVKRDSHFAYAFVDSGVLGKGGYFAGCELKHSDLALFDSYLGLDNVDLLLSLDSLTFDLLDELERYFRYIIRGLSIVVGSPETVEQSLGLTFCKASFGIDIFQR